LSFFSEENDFCKLQNSEQYSALAEIYDRIMDHVDYHSWVVYILSVFTHFNVTVNNILEIACGTGTVLSELTEKGYNVTGFDKSFSMVKNAALKLSTKNIPIKLFNGDMTSIPINFKFDAIICLYDSINYLKEQYEFEKALNEIYSLLKDTGIVIFDICTVKNSNLFFSFSSMTDDFGDFKYERICKFDNSERIQENCFKISGPNFKTTEKHFQKIYFIYEVKMMVEKCGFKILGIFDDMSFRKGTEESERVHFVLKK